MTNKYYWIKLKTNFFNQETIDFLLSQENGCKYVVLYQMLCLSTANNNGLMCSELGEMIVPYDANKIARDTKYFDVDTVIVALELFKKLGLIYKEENGILKIANIEKMVGSESANREAERKRAYRLKQKTSTLPQLNSANNNTWDNNGTNCPTDIDKDIDIDIEKEKINKKEKDFSSEFEELWKLYPRKEGKQVALRVYNTCRKNNETTFEEVKQGILNYIKQIEKNKTQYQYIQHGSTWFNQKRWTDVYEIPTTKKIEEQEISEEKRNIMSLLAED